MRIAQQPHSNIYASNNHLSIHAEATTIMYYSKLKRTAYMQSENKIKIAATSMSIINFPWFSRSGSGFCMSCNNITTMYVYNSVHII